MVLYRVKPTEFTKKLLAPINKFTKAAGYKTDIEKISSFSTYEKNLLRNKVIPFAIVLKSKILKNKPK
jgi:hypothetical protein